MTMTSTVTVDTRGSQLERARLYRLGSWAARNSFKVIVIWLVVLAGGAASASYFASHLTSNSNVVTGSDSQQAAQLIKKEFPGAPGETDFAVLHSQRLTAQDEAFRRAVSTATDRYRSSPLVTAAASPYTAPQQLISPDRHTALITVSLDGSAKKLTADAAPLQNLAERLTTAQIQVYFTGSSPLAATEADHSSADLARAEDIGFPAAAVVLLIAFGSLVAAAIPLVLGFTAVLIAFGILGIASIFTSFDVFVQTAVSMLGIALGIDYSLFIVTRFREELARLQGNTRHDRARAVGRTLATAGRAVLFSGTIVVVALAGLWLVRSPRVHSIAIGMSAAVVGMMIIAVTLLPAILGLLGTRVNRIALPWARKSLAHPDPEHSAWAKLTAVVMRHPVVIATVGILLLGVLALPAFALRYGVDQGTNTVAGSPAGQGYTLLSHAFAPGELAPVSVAVSSGDAALTDAQLAAISRFTTTVARNGEAAGVLSVTEVLDAKFHGHTTADLELAATNASSALDGILSKNSTTSLITIWPRYSADSPRSARLVNELRGSDRNILAAAHLTSHVGGAPAEIVDITHESSRAMPIVICAVLAVSWLMLLFTFRSLFLPFKAIFMNLLTCGAAFGTAVFVFQQGHGAALLGAGRTGFIQVVLPLFAFALVFGLSMDYEVFMLSRMTEEWHRAGDSRRAVQLGITRTARVITAAAAIMVVVFASFMLTRTLEVKQLGFMLALAVLIDATIVRLLLVPAVMRLMGAWNWWLPGWLDRLLPRISPDKH
jgi:putative drug exporter of the RND superfamily